jgi:hypothetical protein
MKIKSGGDLNVSSGGDMIFDAGQNAIELKAMNVKIDATQEFTVDAKENVESRPKWSCHLRHLHQANLTEGIDRDLGRYHKTQLMATAKYLRLPFRPDMLIARQEHPICSLNESIAQHLHLLVTTYYGECKFDESFGFRYGKLILRISPVSTYGEIKQAKNWRM